ncbi:hypothetical protein ANN_00510 [Periplaneta americana]|uniref:Uncharacterized protein n=1 Tax=Periplaneta americana TaxID=6978 RepID=A0ABQ8TV02_PERAM|nr:hypothetical protein ANN_00510 [Periplaneta americana]
MAGLCEGDSEPPGSLKIRLSGAWTKITGAPGPRPKSGTTSFSTGRTVSLLFLLNHPVYRFFKGRLLFFGQAVAGIVLGGLPPNTFVLRCSHRKKSHIVKSGDLGGQAISPFREMARPGNKAFTSSIEILAVWILLSKSLMLGGNEFQSLGRAIVKEDEYEEVRLDGIVNIVSWRERVFRLWWEER